MRKHVPKLTLCGTFIFSCAAALETFRLRGQPNISFCFDDNLLVYGTDASDRLGRRPSGVAAVAAASSGPAQGRLSAMGNAEHSFALLDFPRLRCHGDFPVKTLILAGSRSDPRKRWCYFQGRCTAFVVARKAPFVGEVGITDYCGTRPRLSRFVFEVLRYRDQKSLAGHCTQSIERIHEARG